MTKSLALLSVLLSLFPASIVCYQEESLYFPSTTIGPESSAFDKFGCGPYSSVSDGRVLKYVNSGVGFVEYAISSPTRPKSLCDGSTNTELEPTCGRPLGLAFLFETNRLYITDAYFGLLEVGPFGGVATVVSTSAGGVAYKFLDALDVDQNTGLVYFTDVSSKFSKSQLNEAFSSGDTSGRLLRYDPRTKQVTVLLQNLGLPVGVAISKDSQFVIVTELVYKRATKLWLNGPKSNQTEIFYNFPGQPDNVKRNPEGDFWFPINNITVGTLGQISLAVRIGEDGTIKETIQLNISGKPYPQYSEFQEFRTRQFAIGSLFLNYVGILA